MFCFTHSTNRSPPCKTNRQAVQMSRYILPVLSVFTSRASTATGTSFPLPASPTAQHALYLLGHLLTAFPQIYLTLLTWVPYEQRPNHARQTDTPSRCPTPLLPVRRPLQPSESRPRLPNLQTLRRTPSPIGQALHRSPQQVELFLYPRP